MKYTATIAFMDGVIDSSGEVLSCDGVTLPEKSVNVTYDFQGPTVGTALIKKEGDQLIAEVEIDDAAMSPEAVESLHGVVGGTITDRKGHVINKWTVSSIGLTRSPADKRLPTLKRKV